MVFLLKMRNSLNLSSHQPLTGAHRRYFGQNLAYATDGALY